MTVHGLCGLPRSGTTLLANLLAQHPDVYVSGTSALPRVLEAFVDTCSAEDTIRSDLIAAPGTYERQLRVGRAIVDAWYADRPEPVIIDKGRGWIMHRAFLAQLDPHAAVVAVVRDPRDVITSMLRQDERTAAFVGSLGRTAEEITAAAMGPAGMVGGPIRFAVDAIQRGLRIEWVRYETFVVDPLATLHRLTEALDLSRGFAWDLDGIVNVATDVDGLYLGKFPHDGSGPLKAPSTTWRDTLHPGLAQRIAASYPLFMQTFGYA